MPRWKPEREWEGQDAIIIGGGPSLKGFDWGLIEGEHTIGCNSAFTLGSRVCSICLFSDQHWFNKYADELKNFDGRVVTQCEYINENIHFISKMARHETEMTAEGDSLYFGYGCCSGTSAIHLALLMGAKRVFLLGFDGKLGLERESNWHNRVIEPPNQRVYEKFYRGFDKLAKTYQQVFPGTEIFNCNPESAYTQFPFKELPVPASKLFMD
jgi:hypothetical protein